MIPSSQPHLLISSATHEGMRCKNNEDRFGIFTYHLAKDDPTPVVFAVLCDGIGGHYAGEVAADLAVETIRQAVADSRGDQPLETLRQGIQAASQAIQKQAAQDSERKGMGATCVCAWVIANRLYMASVGDSRLYLLRRGEIRQLTTDHTWIQEALDFGLLTPQQAQKHPNQHVIRRYLGSAEPPETDFRLKLSDAESSEQSLANQGLRLETGDRLLLCSDGLSDLVQPAEILQIVQTRGQEGAPRVLVALANERGGHDNITVVVLEYPGESEPDPSTTPTVVSVPPEEKSQQKAGKGCLATGIGLMALIGLVVHFVMVIAF